ncbi:three-Cys-motif partner protein TcmP [Terrimonas alba]|uniref:three-Cys-motif partner protein TcmP n=1 Tax=Terrimonas alba TaxID=3349636 RepID=UPI0035F2C4DE
MSKKNPKKLVLPHSKAKLDLYKTYLKEYLPILGHSKFIEAINIFDIFCGTGIYDDGNMGSPLIAASCVLDYEAYFQQRGQVSKRVNLFINDFDENKVYSVSELIGSLPFKNCKITPFNLDASEMMDLVGEKINGFSDKERSLVFIDPYGYSKIERDKLYQLLKRRRSEVILFLPVAHMKRFTDEALTDYEKKAYENLRKFIHSFFETSSKVITEVNLNIFDYIEELRKAFSFNGEFYTASHYIERNKANYYALFFIGHHIYGLEKFIEAKWKNDSLGKGFNQRSDQSTLFGETLTEYDKNISISNLKKLFRSLIGSMIQVSNIELYEFTLRNQFKASHMSQVLREMKANKIIEITDYNGISMDKTPGFGLTYTEYKSKKATYIFRKR